MRFPFYVENTRKLLSDLFMIDVSLKNLNGEMLLVIVLFGSNGYKDTVGKEMRYSFIQ